MSTRAIITSQPDVACFVCERRLLRGEQPEIFLADGERRTVCELCAPRAAHEGWRREHDVEGATLATPRPERRRSLWARLRGEAAVQRHGLEDPSAGLASEEVAHVHLPFDQLPAAPEGGSDAGFSTAHEATAPDAGEVAGQPLLERAVAAFNRGEYPRRIASLSRSLGDPEVSVQLDEDLRIVTLVVAWELCWYSYRIDPDEVEPVARPIGQGTELDQLGGDERLANAVADEVGAISLAASGRERSAFAGARHGR